MEVDGGGLIDGVLKSEPINFLGGGLKQGL